MGSLEMHQASSRRALAGGGAAVDQSEATQDVDGLAQLLVAGGADIAGGDRGLLAFGRLRRGAGLLSPRGRAARGAPWSVRWGGSGGATGTWRPVRGAGLGRGSRRGGIGVLQ